MKKILVLTAVVIGVHCAAITTLFLVQGCKTTKKSAEPSVPVMPPISAPSVAPAKVEPVAPATKTEETTEYIVKSGDSLGLIAKRHNISQAELLAVNKLTDPNKIRVGQKLVIPKRAHAAVAPAAKAKPKEKKGEPTTPSLAAGVGEYVVAAGDSLSKISAKFKVNLSELREANKLVNDKLRIGQKLIIPGAKKAEGASEPAPAAPAAPATTAKPEAPAAIAPAAAEPAVTNDAAAAPKAAGAGITHVVMPNEDISSIAKLYAVTVEDIVAANQLKTNQTLQAGQKIIIP